MWYHLHLLETNGIYHYLLFKCLKKLGIFCFNERIGDTHWLSLTFFTDHLVFWRSFYASLIFSDINRSRFGILLQASNWLHGLLRLERIKREKDVLNLIGYKYISRGLQAILSRIKQLRDGSFSNACMKKFISNEKKFLCCSSKCVILF